MGHKKMHWRHLWEVALNIECFRFSESDSDGLFVMQLIPGAMARRVRRWKAEDVLIPEQKAKQILPIIVNTV
jgi:hypothetical protein